MAKHYSELEKFLYTNPDEEAGYLSGAFQSVSYGAASILVGPLIGLAALFLTHKNFSKPYMQNDKEIRQAHFNGFASGLVLTLAVGAISAGGAAEDTADGYDGQELSQLTTTSQPLHLQSGPAHR